jgi:hypothetical protein
VLELIAQMNDTAYVGHCPNRFRKYARECRDCIAYDDELAFDRRPDLA